MSGLLSSNPDPKGGDWSGESASASILLAIHMLLNFDDHHPPPSLSGQFHT